MGESTTPGSKVTMSRYLATGGPFRSTGSGARSLDADTLGTEPPPVSRHRSPIRGDGHAGQLHAALPERRGEGLVLRPRAAPRLADRTAGLPEAGGAGVRAGGGLGGGEEHGL